MPSKPPHPPRLVIVDDEPKLVEVVAAIARATYPDPKDLVIESILTAEAAIVAIRRASAAHELAIVVISDFNLPPSSLNGIEVLDEVRRRLPRARRVLMTGQDPEELADIVRDARLDAFIPKPFAFQEMSNVIERLVREVALERPLDVGQATTHKAL